VVVVVLVAAAAVVVLAVVMRKSFTSFGELQVFTAASLNVLVDNLVRAARDSRKLTGEGRSGRTGS